MTDLQWAVSEFSRSKRLKAYATYEAYYNGQQPLAYATEKYRSQFWRLFKGFSDNMCQSVVDVQAERLEIIGYASSEAKIIEQEIPDSAPPAPPAEPPPPPTPLPDGTMHQPPAPPPPPKPENIKVSIVDDPIGDAAWNNWEDDSLALVADLVHTDVFQYGDAFVISDENGTWRQHPAQMAVQYSDEQPGVILRAAKLWTEASTGRMRLNIWSLAGEPGTPASLSKYRSTREMKGSTYSEDDFEGIEGGGPLPYGIPVIHFANKTYGGYGASELENVIPLQDALNKAEMDLILAMEYQSFRQRWIAGVDVEIDEDTGLPKNFPGQHGPGNFLAFADAETKVGEFSMADLTPYVKVIENLRGQIARVSGIPLHYFFVGEGSGATVSGESLKVGETRFERKGKRQQRCFGKSWEHVMDLVLEIDSEESGTDVYDPEVDLDVVWEELSPRSDSEELDVLVKKNVIGVPFAQLQRELGYEPEEIERFAVQYREDLQLGTQGLLSGGGAKGVTPTAPKVTVAKGSSSGRSGEGGVGGTPATKPPSN